MSIHTNKKFQPIKLEQRIELERILGEPLPNGLEIHEVCIPAGTGLWQLDDEYEIKIRYSSKITPEDRAINEALAERNPYFRRLMSEYCRYF